MDKEKFDKRYDELKAEYTEKINQVFEKYYKKLIVHDLFFIFSYTVPFAPTSKVCSPDFLKN